jgi:DNA-binding XRE family transcriptional regulator
LEQKEENLVKKTCRELGISQTQLAEKIGVSNNTISSWKNKKQPMPKWAYKLLELIEIEKRYHQSLSEKTK